MSKWAQKKNLKYGDREIWHRKCFLKNGGLNLHAMHLQENYEMEEFSLSLSRNNASFFNFV